MAIKSKNTGPGPARRYSVSEVVRATGITEHTLRAWERRHSAIAPERTPGGTRRYSVRDLARLVKLKRAVDDGQRIGSIAGRSDAELEALLASGLEGPRGQGSGRTAPLWEPVYIQIVRLDSAEAEKRLSHLFGALGPVEFGKQVVLPLMAAVGEGWHDGELSPAAEHMATEIVRSLLGVAIRSQPRSASRFTLVTTTLTGERHEAGLLVACLLAIDADIRVVHLGVELPAHEIARAASSVGADAVLLGMSMPDGEAMEHLRELSKLLNERTEIWTGGPPSDARSSRDSSLHFNSIGALQEHLRTIGRVGQLMNV